MRVFPVSARVKLGFSKIAFTGMVLGTIFSPNAFAADISLSEEARALTAPVFEAYENIDREHAALPEPQSIAEQLIRMRQLDQDGRIAWAKIDLSSLPQEQRDAARDEMWREIYRRDLLSQTQLKAMLPSNGWFQIGEYGEDAVRAAFLIVQHAANDPDFQKEILARMEPLLAMGEVDADAYGMLYDRTAMLYIRFQRYGSQMICRDNQWVLWPLEDPDGVDERREVAGFELGIEQNLARWVDRFPCQGDDLGPFPE